MGGSLSSCICLHRLRWLQLLLLRKLQLLLPQEGSHLIRVGVGLRPLVLVLHLLEAQLLHLALLLLHTLLLLQHLLPLHLRGQLRRRLLLGGLYWMPTHMWLAWVGLWVIQEELPASSRVKGGVREYLTLLLNPCI